MAYRLSPVCLRLAPGHVGYGDDFICPDPIPVAAMAGAQVQTVAAWHSHSLALGWDGRVYSWGYNAHGELGHGDTLDRPSPVLVEELQGVCGIASACAHSMAVTQSGAVFSWGCAVQLGSPDSLRPTIVEGFGGVRVRRVHCSFGVDFAIGESGELFSWGCGRHATLGHADGHYPNRPIASRRCRAFV
jgi:alpha-tubulin suppressor-like RCC1 family protein